MKLSKDKSNTVTLPEINDSSQNNSGTAQRTPITHRLWAKVTAYFLTVIMLSVTAGCAAGAVVMWNTDIYVTPEEEYAEDFFESIADTDGEELCRYIVNTEFEGAESYCENRNITSVRLTNSKNNAVLWEWSRSERTGNKEYAFQLHYDMSLYSDCEDVDDMPPDVGKDVYDGQIYVELTVDSGLGVPDNYAAAYEIIDIAYTLRYAVYVIAAVSFIIASSGFIFLVCASGHKKGVAGVQPGWGTKIPFDLLTAFVALAITGICAFIGYLTVTSLIIPLAAIGAVLIAALLTGWSMSFALRVKLGKLWKNTVIFYALRLLWKAAKALAKFVSGFPLIWKAVLIVAGASLVELIMLIVCCFCFDAIIPLWLLSSVVFGGAALYIAFGLKKLQKGGEALASGDLSCQIDASGLHGDLRKHAESLNSIAQGMTIAVDERLKSERLKTELITNVSHDIKTPLTSIINYTDLISKEPCSNEKIKEYSEVLLRQSERLKRLIEDLVEASKASTGNIEVLLAPCKANILLTQAIGEYGEKLDAKNLELITSQPDTPITIMADGRRLWRVFDNLLSNICKYAQSSTRVYLSLEELDSEAVITFKNTSHSPLNISADELMERFVRGNSSRSTEGNGLGLSIAKSLTELQNGRFELSVDGDLFKVTLRFPTVYTNS